MNRSRLSMLAVALPLSLLVGGASFEIGRRWPIETVTRLFGPPPLVLPPGWTELARTDLPRYEMIRVRVGRELLLLGGFHTSKIEATTRVESLDLVTRQWKRRADLPVALTHTSAVVVRDTLWLAGGFEGNHPGPASARVWRYALQTDTWSPGPALPAARGGGAFVALGDTLHYFGGYLPDRNTNSADHWTLTIGATSWDTAASLPHPRGHLAGAVIAGSVYAIGGADGHDPTPIDVSTLDRYDARTDAWEALPSAPYPLSHTEPSTTQYEGWLLVAGGRSNPLSRESMDGVLLYDPVQAQWTHLGRMPLPMMGGLADVYGDTLIAGMGSMTSSNPETPNLWRAALRNQWWSSTPMPEALGEVAAGVIGRAMFVVGEGSRNTLRYDLASGEWQTLTNAARPAPGHHHAAEVLNGTWYLLGGIGAGSERLVQLFDPATSRWTRGPALPFAAGSSASAVIDGRIYVAGGIGNGRTTDSAAVLDLATNTWRVIAPMPHARNHAASATDGARFFVFGGRGPGSGDSNVVANGFDDVQVYDPKTNTWTTSGSAPSAPTRLPAARGGTGKAVFLDGEFWIIGGETLDGAGASKTNTYDRVDIYDPRTNRWRAGPPLPTARHGLFPVLADGRILVAGGGLSAGFGASATFESIWPR